MPAEPSFGECASRAPGPAVVEGWRPAPGGVSLTPAAECRRPILRTPAPVTAAAAAIALDLAIALAWRQLPPTAWARALLDPAPGDVAELLFHYALLPRLATAFLVGAGLALAGAIAQQVLDNPLAAPSTLGVSAGAELALVVAALVRPGGFGAGREAIATAGALAAAAIVGAIAARHRFAPATTVLGGLAVALFASAVAAGLKLADQEEVEALYLWGAGSLAGTDPETVLFLLPRLVVLAAAAALLGRPIALLGLSEGSARSLGIAVAPVRVAALLVSILIASSVTVAVGLVGFVELLAPALARAAGARRFGAVAVHATLIGGCLLVVVDATAAWASSRWGVEVPTGAVAALVGAPALLVLVTRLKAEPFRAAAGDAAPSRPSPSARTPGIRTALLVATLGIVLALSLAVGRTGQGWTIVGMGAAPGLALAYHLPRSLAALGAGALLSGAGTLLQRLTGNALVGPETLGLGAGAAAGLAVALIASADPSPATLLLAGLAGALMVLVILAATAAGAQFAPERLLLAGVALGAVLQAVLSLAMSLGDARATRLLAFVSGSTVAVPLSSAVLVVVLALVLCPAALLLGRVLDVLALGEALARSLGVPLGPTRAFVALLAALMTAAAVETVGPLSFVGLLGPQIALRLGFRRGAAQLGGSALVGASAMAAADAIGRTVAAPFEIPAGLVASAIGIPVFVVLLLRRGSRGE